MTSSNMFMLQNIFGGSDGVRMAFSPNESDQSGGGQLVIAFSDESPLRSDAEYFVAFEGSYLRHVVTVKRISALMFHSHIPEHRVPETVQLSMLMTREGNTKVLATSIFKFLPDAMDGFAEFLISSVYEPGSLDNIDHLRAKFSDVLNAVDVHFDRRLCQRLSHLCLPDGWHMLGLNRHNPVPQETLLHLCAKLGLRWTALYLMTLPGGQQAAKLPNLEDDTPADLSNMYGHLDMAELFMGKLQCWSGDPPWQESKRSTSPTKIERISSDIFILTSNLNESQKTLHDDLALMQHVWSTSRQPPTSVLAQGKRSQSVTESSVHSPGVAPSLVTSGSNSRKRSKSAGLMVKEGDPDVVGQSTVSRRPVRQSQGHLYEPRYAQTTSHCRLVGQPPAYDEHDRRRTPANCHGRQTDVIANSGAVVMETATNVGPPANQWPGPGPAEAGFQGNQNYDAQTDRGPSEWERPVLEESLRKLEQIQKQLQLKLSQSVHNKIVSSQQDERKENLHRFSTSCPSLPDIVSSQQESQQETSNQEPGVADQGEGHHDQLSSSGSGYASQSAMCYTSYRHVATTSSMDMRTSQPSPNQLQVDPAAHSHQDITIRINDVTIDNTDDYAVPSSGSEEANAALIEQIKKANKRRSSWCPEEGRKKEEKHEKQKMLNISGRSQSLSSLDGDSDEDEEDADNDETSSVSYQQSPASEGGHTSYSATSSQTTPLTEPTGGALRGSPTTHGPRTADDVTSPVLSGYALSTRVSHKLSADGQTMSPANGHMSHSGPTTPGDSCLSPCDDPNVLMYHNNLTKASSSPSIATDEHHDNKEAQITDLHDHSKTLSHQSGEETEEDSDTKSDWLCAQTQGTLLEHTDAAVAVDEEEDQPKIEKKRKGSVFSMLGSYRQKNKVVRDTKLLKNNAHQFVGVCFSNSTPCDVCSKSMSNKLALQCENCMVNVHENSCKDQIATCARYRATKAGNGDNVKKSSSLPVECANNNVNLKSSQSLKETRRAISVPGHPVLQSSGSSCSLGTRASSPSRVISEERDKTKDEDSVQSSSQFLDTNSIPDAMTASTESLEEGSGLVVDIDEDFAEESEAWSVTVDKKTLKKMSAKDIKRQDHIWELIQTERSHCRTLKIMQKVFSRGMRQEANISQDMIDRIFPCLGELIDIHTTFLHKLTERQSLRPDRSIDEIGDILLQQFDGEMGERMKVAYGDFCSRHTMAVQLYKDILKSDRKFQNFIKKCNRSSVCKRLSIPECILLVTQRVTKYPLIIEPIIKTTKDDKTDKDRLLKALSLMKQILVYIDAQVDAHEKEQRLIEIYNKLDARSYATYMGKKFKKSKLLASRKLIHEGYMRWMTARGKSFEVLAVILSDVMFFLAENNQKLTFFSQDSKSSVVPLSKLLVREKGDTRDSKGMYLIVQSKTEPEMYEFICRSAEERKTWIKVIRAAVLKCMEVEGIDVSKRMEIEEEKKELEAKSARIRQLVDRLYERDNVIKQQVDEKMNIIIEMLEVFCKEEINRNLQTVYKEDATDLLDQNVWASLKSAIHDSSHFLAMVLLGKQCTGQSWHTDHEPPVCALPRRAETFSGFEQKEKVKKRFDSNQLGEGSRSGSQRSLNETESQPESTDSVHSERRGRKEKVKGQNAVLQGRVTSDADNERSTSPDPEPGFMANDLLGLLQGFMSTPSKEHCQYLAQLMQYFYGLVCVTNNLLTEVEKLRAQLSEANSKVSTLYAENKRLAHGFHQDKRLEILREQQEALSQERTELDRLREYDRKEREEELAKLKKQREQMEKEKAELQAQKEEIEHRKEVLQRQMDLFEENKRRLLQQTKDTVKVLTIRERSESPSSRGISPAGHGSPQVSLLDTSHRRSGSEDAATRVSSPDRVPDAGANPVPLHLLSATNEQKLAAQGAAKLPMAAPSAPSGALSRQQSSSGVQQMLPIKLTQSGSRSQLASGSGGQQTKSSTGDGGGGGGGSGARGLTHSQSQRPLVSVGRTNSGTRVPAPATNIVAGGNILPMKLAEKPRPKSASAASSAAMVTHHHVTSPAATTTTPTSTADKSHSSKRSSTCSKREDDVIYF